MVAMNTLSKIPNWEEQPDLRQDEYLDQNSELVKFLNQRVLRRSL